MAPFSIDPLHMKTSRPVLFTFAASLLIFSLGCASDPNRRTPGVVIDDFALENIVESEIRKSDPGYKGSHIVVVSHNGVVLLAGQVATQELRDKASTVAQGLRRVRKVHNELTVGGPTSLVARSNDAWLTTKVKARLVAGKADGTKIKVQTEDSIVYLMGMVTRAQADAAIDIAKDVYGVQKIVKVFEYLD